MLFLRTAVSFLKDKEYRDLLITTLAIIGIGSVVYHYLEGWSWVDAIYFSVITLSTIGYGDFSPTTIEGKIFTIFYIIIGVGIILSFINTLYRHYSSMKTIDDEKKARKFLFHSARLGFRNWHDSDLNAMAAINADAEVMKYFPHVQSLGDTLTFIERMQTQFTKSGYCYFAVETLKHREFIGFIGLNQSTFESDFTPCVDIGWRLNKKYWGKGFATEGALRCLEYGFTELEFDKIYSIASKGNKKSIQVMKNSGMDFVKSFKHSKLIEHPDLLECDLYVIDSEKYQK